MFPWLMQMGKYMFIVSCYAIEHRKILVSIYSLYDFTKFSFYIMDKIGITDVISNAIKKRYHTENVLIEISVEKSDVGDFEIIDLS